MSRRLKVRSSVERVIAPGGISMNRENERPRTGGSEAAANKQYTRAHSTPPSSRPEATEPPAGITLAGALAELTAILPRLADALGRRPESKPPVDRFALRLDELADAFGVSRRALERERAAGRLPKPDLHIGKMPLWRVETVRAWLERGG